MLGTTAAVGSISPSTLANAKALRRPSIVSNRLLARQELPPGDFHRIVGDNAMYATLPNAPGGIDFVMDALRSMTEALFDPSIDLEAIAGSASVPATF